MKSIVLTNYRLFCFWHLLTKFIKMLKNFVAHNVVQKSVPQKLTLLTITLQLRFASPSSGNYLIVCQLYRIQITTVSEVKSPENQAGQNREKTDYEKCISESIVNLVMNELGITFKKFQDNQSKCNPESYCKLLIDRNQRITTTRLISSQVSNADRIH